MEQFESRMRSSPVEAIKAVISSPNWVGNLLWLSLAALAQSIFIGQIGLYGYGAELIRKRAGRPGGGTSDIDSERLGDYISKGVWPFFVQLVMQFAVVIIIGIPAIVVLLLGIGLGAGVGGDTGLAVALVVGYPVFLGTVFLASLCSTPFVIRSMVCQDFQQSFDFGWSLGFVKIMFGEILLSSIVFAVLSVLLIILGIACCGVGYIPALGLIMGGMMNLMAQWYEIYLSRGGMPAPSPLDEVIDATIV